MVDLPDAIYNALTHFDVPRETCCFPLSYPRLVDRIRDTCILSGYRSGSYRCLSREEDCPTLDAETQILGSACGLTTSSRTVEALVRTKQRGIDVRLIAERTTPCERNSGVDVLARAGIPIWRLQRSDRALEVDGHRPEGSRSQAQ